MEFKVDTLADAVKAMMPDWELVDALWGGTRAMREHARRYLPQRPLEEDDDYRDRLAAATLFPAFSETVESMTGRVFSEPLQQGEDIPSWITDEVLEDIDLKGNKIDVFAQRWFQLALRKGHALALIDSPRTDKKVRTMADQKAAKLRPYFVLIDPDRVLGWIEDDNGILQQIRIRFWRREKNEFHSEVVEQIRVFEPGRVRIYERPGNNAKEEFVQVDEYGMEIDAIPIVNLSLKETGTLTSEPPLRELAFLNAKHWRMQSGNDTLIETASVPILAISGVSDGEEVVIGAKHALKLPVGAEAKYVEHTGKAIEAGRQALQDLKDEMRQAHAKLLQPRSGQAKTATEAGEDASRENSLLGRMVQALDDALEHALVMCAKWRREEKGGTISAQPNLDYDPSPHESMETVLKMYVQGIIDRQTAFEEAKRRGFVSDEAEWEDVLARIETERETIEDEAEGPAGPTPTRAGTKGTPTRNEGGAE